MPRRSNPERSLVCSNHPILPWGLSFSFCCTTASGFSILIPDPPNPLDLLAAHLIFVGICGMDLGWHRIESAIPINALLLVSIGRAVVQVAFVRCGTVLLFCTDEAVFSHRPGLDNGIAINDCKRSSAGAKSATLQLYIGSGTAHYTAVRVAC